VLAAWIDGQLSAGERSAAEAHAADCAHCQAMLAAMARMAPPPPARAWWSAPAVRWLVPVAAATLVIATVIGVTRERRAPSPGAAKEVSAVTEPARSASPAPAELSAPPASVAGGVTVPQTKSEPAKVATRERKDQERRDRVQSADTPAAFAADERLRVDALAGAAAPPATPSAAATSPPAAPPPAAPPPASLQTPPAANAAASAPVAQTPPAPVPLLPLQETVTVKSEAALAKGEAALDKVTARDAAARMRPVEVISPERAYRWRSLTPGSIQYSIDGGMSWRPSSTGTAVALHAGSAPSRTVCWLVGQAGTVLLTIDGQNWQVRPFPERVDLTDVRATDARHATVTDSSLRRFATSDGGATWSPLQEN
jgi:hypothetical protein